jgi:dTDP-4-dehydrorhamnose reductase
MSVIVLGATGYLGRAIGAELLDRRRCEVLHARGLDDLDGGRVAPGDVVVNCAGHIGGAPTRLEEANVQHARRVAEACRRQGARLIHLSSSAVFDGIRSGRISEDTPPRPRSAYGRSKLRGEIAVMRALPQAQVMRPAKVFGGDDPRGRLHALVGHVRRGRALPVPGRADLWANFVWVGDLASTVADAALGPGEEGVTHLATPCPWPLFVQALGEAVGRPVRRPRRPVEHASGVVAGALARLPASVSPRPVQRLLELWDRRELVDSQARFPANSIRRGLDDVARRAQ